MYSLRPVPSHGILAFVIVLSAVNSPLLAQELCVDIGDPAGNFIPRGFCAPADPGAVGGPVNIQLNERTFSVLDDPDGRLDIIVPLEHSITANAEAPITYSTSLMWPSAPVSQDSIRVRELGVNFKPDPASPRFAALTNLMAGDDPPPTFSWVTDPADATKVIGWTVQNELAGIASDIGGSISHYHMTTWDLPVGTEVTFSKSVTGGTVVPEPSTCGLLVFGAIGALDFCRRRRRAPSEMASFPCGVGRDTAHYDHRAPCVRSGNIS